MITVDTAKAIIGGVAATGSAISSKALYDGVIPDQLEEVTFYMASVTGLLIAIFALISAVQRQLDRRAARRKNTEV